MTHNGGRVGLGRLESSTGEQRAFACSSKSNPDPEGTVLHDGVLCDNCEMEPIKGTRFNCQDCGNYDLCCECYEQRGTFHQPGHTFSAFKLPQQNLLMGQPETVTPEALREMTGRCAVRTDQVQGVLQSDDLLLEYYAYEPTSRWESFQTDLSLHYSVFAVTSSSVDVVDLGDANDVNTAAECFRQLIVDDCQPKSTLLKAGFECYKKLLQPVDQFLLGRKGSLYIAVDGELGRFPFAAVPMDEQGEKFIFDHPSNLSHIISGWALPRLACQSKDKLVADAAHPWTIIGDPSFIWEEPGSSAPLQDKLKNAHAEPTYRGRGMDFKALRWTAAELEGVREVWAAHMPGTMEPTMLQKQGATVQAVMELDSPCLLHFATHGFFLQLTEHWVRCHPHCLVEWATGEAWECAASLYDEGCKSENCSEGKWYRCVHCNYNLCELCLERYRYVLRPGNRSSSVDIQSRMEEILLSKAVGDPFLRVGLALAGSQSFQNNLETPKHVGDGLLTGRDVLTMNLQGTSLVYLSACQLALGSATYGTGLAGCGRAFLAAGAKNLIMALWDVSDKHSKDVAIGFYKAWLDEGVDMTTALRRQQQILRQKQPFRPALWAAFVFYHGYDSNCPLEADIA